LVAFLVAFLAGFDATFLAAFFVTGIRDPVQWENNGRTTRYRPRPLPPQFMGTRNVPSRRLRDPIGPTTSPRVRRPIGALEARSPGAHLPTGAR
jgi:hypothetical protein